MADEIINTFGFNVSDALNSLGTLEKRLETTGRAFESLAAVLTSWNAQAAATVGILEKLGAARGFTLGKQFDDMARSAKTATAATSELDAVQKRLQAAANKVFTNTRTPAEAHAIQVKNLDEMLAKGAITQDTHTRAVNQSAEAANKAGQSTRQWMLSWETFARVLQTQALVRGLNMVRDAFTESFEAALKFSKEVGEIHAVDSSRNFGQIAADLRHLSDSFNQPLSDVAEAQYQTISNQFVTTAQRADILSAANALSKTTAQSLGDAVQVLAGQLNAYGESSDQAGLRASQLFTTVQLGHMRLSDLQTALGRVQSIAVESGVSIEELESSLVTLSLGGLKASEAATQLRGVMTAFLKPTQDMKKAFEELGVSSGEDAFATWGFQEALTKVVGTTDGSTSAIAKLLPNVRGLAGALRMAEEGAAKYHEAMEKIGQSDRAMLNKKLEEFTSTDAERLTREINKLKNFFTTDFGAEIVGGLHRVSGGTDMLIGALRTLGGDSIPLASAAVVAAGAALVVYRLRSTEAASATRMVGFAATDSAAQVGLLSKAVAAFNPVTIGKTLAADLMGSFSGAMQGLALGEMARMGGNAIGEMIYDKFISQEATRQALSDRLEGIKQQNDAEVRLAKEKDDKILKSIMQRIAEESKVLLKQQDRVREEMKIEGQVTKTAFEHIVSERQKLTHELGTISTEADKKAEETIPRTIAEIKAKQDERHFEEREKKIPVGEQSEDWYWRVKKQLNEASEAQSQAKDQNQEKLAQDKWATLQESYKKYSGLAHTPQQLEDARRVQDQIDNTKIESLKKQQELQRRISEEAQQRQAQAERHDMELDDKRRLIEERLKPTIEGEKGTEYKSATQWKADSAEAKKMIAEYKAELEKDNKEDFGKVWFNDQKAFDSMRRESEKSLASGYVQRLQVGPTAMDDFQAELQRYADRLRIKVPAILTLEKETGIDLGTQGPAKLFKEAKALWGHEAERQAGRGSGDRAERELHETFDSAFKDLQERSSQYLTNPALHNRASSETISQSKEFQGFLHEAAMLMGGKGKITDADLGRMQKLLSPGDIQAVVPFGQQSKATEDAATILSTLQDLKAVRDQMPAAKPLVDPNDTQVIEDQVEAFDRLKSSIDSVVSAAAALRSAQAGTAHECSGGFLYRAGGGDAQGTDTIPAMLSPGEFVVSAASARKWYSQLIAMNAGVQPVFRDKGGSVTNVGDISVTVNGGNTGQQTAREIALGLRRELRRGNHVF